MERGSPRKYLFLQQSRRAEEPRERERESTEKEVNIRGEQRGKTSPTNKKTKT